MGLDHKTTPSSGLEIMLRNNTYLLKIVLVTKLRNKNQRMLSIPGSKIGHIRIIDKFDIGHNT